MKRVFFGLYIDPELHGKFKTAAEKQFRTMADQMRMLISDFVAETQVKRGKKNAKSAAKKNRNNQLQKD